MRVAILLAVLGGMTLAAVGPDIVICKCHWEQTKDGWQYVCCK